MGASTPEVKRPGVPGPMTVEAQHPESWGVAMISQPFPEVLPGERVSGSMLSASPANVIKRQEHRLRLPTAETGSTIGSQGLELPDPPGSA